MSKPLVVSIPHHLGKQEALRRLKDGIGYLKTNQSNRISVLEDKWLDDRLEFLVGAMGQTASGSLDVADDQVICTVQLPWVLALLADKAKGLIQKEGTLLLEKK
ncbi:MULTISPECIES: polyhydroxyalkanoic acid system family protein [Lichenihabitans]|uniref:polyhydroxyalkanoic acid system family protein n=1 Tax=Lichenihabitans TaxID=2723776 RepID=UPI001035ABBE|nr:MULTISPECIES: polyhydroxyalkanoic acid system family protein [Lichenihabitans]UDL95189.1 polyhydroxyalkanoic acid system family protein [Lichenihabitans sp. PAMC28606]